MKEKFPSDQENLARNLDAFLTLPSRIEVNNPDKTLGKNLGAFLINNGFINEIRLWNGSWGFKYEDRKIFLAEQEMSQENYEYYIFRLGVNSENGESLFPQQGDETDQYRFLHETNHAYQDYLTEKESVENHIAPSSWHDKASTGEIDSTFALLFNFCYQNRLNNQDRGLSTWGNVPDYNDIHHSASQRAIRAIEDANELITMYVWHPEYLETFLNYVSLNIPGYTETDVNRDRLTKISRETKEGLKALVKLYIEEMKREVSHK